VARREDILLMLRQDSFLDITQINYQKERVQKRALRIVSGLHGREYADRLRDN
jgi:hypothetical protein